MLTIEELSYIYEFLQGRMPVSTESMRIPGKIYKPKELVRETGKKEIQVII